MISSIDRSLENPAAWRWPPPFDLRAIAETSTRSLDDRSEIFRAGPLSRGGSRISAASSAPSTARRMSMIPSEYGSTAPTSREVVAQEVRDDDPALVVERRSLERAREQLQLRELHRLVDALEDTLQVGARLEQARPRAAARFGVVFAYWNRPVSVTSPV